jgi:dipeptidyl aminopeptidase/acylaminoacyl peptidase
MTAPVPSSRREALVRAARVALVAAVALLPMALLAQNGRSGGAPTLAPGWADKILKLETYATPPLELAPAVLAPRYLNVSLTNASPDKKWFLDEIGDGPVVMKTFSKPFHELGGVFIDYKANRARSLTINNNVGIQILSATDGSRRKIEVPAGARVSNAVWSPDGASVAYFVHGEDATHIWLADVATGKSRQITTAPVLATLVSSVEFTNDSRQILTVLAPDGRAPMPPPAPVAPTGPEVKVASGTKAHLATFPSLMTLPHEFDLLEWHATGQIALVDVATRAVKKIGAPTMARTINVSPNGQYFRVTRMTKPFSYMVPVNSFGQVEEVWDSTGKALTELSKRAINLGALPDDTNPPDPAAAPQAGGGRGANANQNGKRDVAWRLDGQGLTYLEQDPAPAGANGGGAGGGGGRAGGGRGAGGNGAPQGPPRKDHVMQWLPPFDATSMKLVYENSTRMAGHRFSPDMTMLFYTETTGTNGTDYAVYLSDPTQRYALMKCNSADANAVSAGTLVATRSAPAGRGGGGGGGGRGGGCAGGSGPVLLSADGQRVFYSGVTYDRNPDQVGPKSFVDSVAIKTGEKSRLYESDNKDLFERVTSIINPDAKTFVVLREGPTTNPQNFLVTGDARKQLTNNEDIAPDLTSAPKRRYDIQRPDGFRFRVRVTLPVGYQEGTRLPAIFWVYPSEYDTQEAHDRPDRTFNKNAFPNFGARSMEFFIRMGYAVIQDAPDHLPIVGPAGQQNNNYVNDLRNDLAAVIDELDRRGIIDRQRLAIGGHSYGAFTTVNAMVNTPFFKAGIAGDGAYNRTLTPFGFQSERRTLWEAPNVYFDMSPFLRADHLSGALLMYHGLHDQNTGTDPINSERLFQALSELGKTAAMYRYPLEDHGPASRETLLDLWARWAAWLDKYVKNPEAPAVKPAAPVGRGGGGSR